MTQIWISAAGLCGASILGSALGFFFKRLSDKWNATALGYCAGVMLAASTIGLIVPAVEMTDNWLSVVAGVLAGALFLNVLDLITPHLHHITGLEPEEHTHNKRLGRVLLFVMAIAIHKLPEGMAAGVSMSGAENTASWMVSAGIALQNIPEGMVVIAPLLVAGVSGLRTCAISISIGLLEIVGVWFGYGLGALSEAFLPAMLGFAGGAMLYVTSDEMIPETHAGGYQKRATYALLLGFLTMVLMEKALGGA